MMTKRKWTEKEITDLITLKRYGWNYRQIHNHRSINQSLSSIREKWIELKENLIIIEINQSENFKQQLAKKRVEQGDTQYNDGEDGWLCDPVNGTFFWYSKKEKKSNSNQLFELSQFFKFEDSFAYQSCLWIEDWYSYTNYFSNIENMISHYKNNSVVWQKELEEYGESDDYYIADVIDFCEHDRAFTDENDNFERVYEDRYQEVCEKAYNDIFKYIFIQKA
jgi:hypothetical protein